MPVGNPITDISSAGNFVPITRTLTINGVAFDLSANRSWTVGTGSVTSVGLIMPTGFAVSSSPITSAGDLTVAFAAGYSLPTTASQTNWDTAYSNRITSLTTTGNSGVSTLISNTLNVPEYTLAGLGGMANVFTTLGDLVYSNAAGAPVRRSPNITTTKMYLSQTGDGTTSAAPQWTAITAADVSAVPTSRTLTINGTTFDLTADRSWSVGTITSLTGEATASGSGAVAVTLTNSAVIGKVLTGLNVTGGTVIATDTILTAFGKLQNQVNGLAGGVTYQGGWNASTNLPALSSGTGTKGYYYVVTTAGSTNLDGITDWKLGDWAIYNGTVWEKVDNTDSVTSVNGFTGAVSLTTANISEATNLYYTDTRSRLAVSLTTTGSSGAATYNNTTGVFNVPQYTLTGLGGVPSSRQLTINGVAYDLSADRTWSVGTVTSVALTMPAAFSVSAPITTSGTLAVAALGTSTQYIRGDGQLAAFPSTASGGSSVNYYLNGSVSSGVVGYQQMDNLAVIGGGTDFALTGNGLIAQFLTDAGNPNRIEIPGGAWNFEMFFQVSSVGGNQKFYVELLKYNGTTFTSIATSSLTPEEITGGTTTDLYLTSLAVPTTSLLVTDRLAIRVYIIDNAGGRTVTLHTENATLCEIITTFAGGVSSLNGLTENTQYFATGTNGSDFNISSVIDTHTFNLPSASATNRGALISADWINFNAKLNNPFLALGDLVYSNSGGIGVRRSGNITTTKMFLSQTGDGTNSAAPQWSTVTSADTGSVPTSRTLTINGIAFDLSADRTYTVGTVTSVALSVPTGLSITGSPITGSGTLAIGLQAGYSIPTTTKQTEWDSAYNDKINSATVTGTTTKTLTLNQQDGGTITASWTDINTDAVTSVFGRTGAVVAVGGDYNTSQVTELTNLYFTDARARSAISLTTSGTSGAATYVSGTGVLNVPNYTAAGLGAVPTSRTLTINDVAFDLTADRSWSVGDFGTW